jgi:membrane protein
MRVLDVAFARVGELVGRGRARSGTFDHLVRAAGRYQSDSGDRLAASVSYYAFLAVFPMMLLAAAVMGFALQGNATLREELVSRLSSYLPGLYGAIIDNLSDVTNHRRGIGLAALAGLVWAGLGWLGSLREAIRLVWHHEVSTRSFLGQKAVDMVTLLALGVTIAVSIAVTGLVGASAGWLLPQLGVEDRSPAAVFATGALGLLLGVAADIALFLFLFKRLPKLDWPLHRLVQGAVFAAGGVGLLKVVGRYYVGAVVTTRSASFGTFAIVAGLLVWMNLVTRLTLFAAAWTVTAPYNDDTAPSGTSSPEARAAAGLSPAQAAAIKEPDVPAPTVVKH